MIKAWWEKPCRSTERYFGKLFHYMWSLKVQREGVRGERVKRHWPLVTTIINGNHTLSKPGPRKVKFYQTRLNFIEISYLQSHRSNRNHASKGIHKVSMQVRGRMFIFLIVYRSYRSFIILRVFEELWWVSITLVMLCYVEFIYHQ